MSILTLPTKNSDPLLKQTANALRFLAIDAVSKANSGHPGMPMGMADIVAVLFSEFLTFDPQDPNWQGRDRFILSNGHGSMLQYGLLHLFGYPLSLEDIKNFRQLGSNTPGHPEFGHTIGVETTTGPLGQGFATAVGMAIGQEAFAARYGNKLFRNKTYVSVGDGCLMEGISHEAADLAGHLKLKNLIALFDSNGICIDGSTSLTTHTDTAARFKAYGWVTLKADGHNYASIRKALEEAQNQEKPVFIEFKTHIGYGSPTLEDTSKAHGSPLTPEEIEKTRKKLEWAYPPFEVPQDVYTFCKNAASRGQKAKEVWVNTLENLSLVARKTLEEQYACQPQKAAQALADLKKEAVTTLSPFATREASGKCVNIIAENDPRFISGSADLTSSNNTIPASYKPLTPKDFSGNYIHYGVREHAMGAILNGLSLYGGFRPLSGTFLVFADYLKPSLRLSALMHQPITYVFTHDSIGLGEDGPTHQPIEQLAMLRATPNLHTWRPADLVEAAECWQTILKSTSTPNALALSRHKLPPVRIEHTAENLCARGAYILRQENGPLRGIFIASGSEVHLAVSAQDTLAKEGVHTRVVSVPSMEIFLEQPRTYQEDVLPQTCQNRIIIEAASSFGWHRFAPQGTLITLDTFGASAPADALFKKFGFNVEHAIHAMKKLITT